MNVVQHTSERAGVVPWVEAATSVGLDELPDGVLVASVDGVIQSANAVFLELVGRSASEVLGQRFESLVAEEDMLNLVGFQATFAENSTRDNTMIFAAPDGVRRSLIVCSIRSRDNRRVVMTLRAAGTVQEALADVSRWVAAEQDRGLELARARDALAAKNAALSAAQAELEAAYAKLQSESLARQRLQDELRLAQRLESIGQLAAGIAHEINTPMQYIGDNVHFLSTAFDGLCKYIEAVESAPHTEAACCDARGSQLAARKKLRIGFVLDEVPRALVASKAGIEHVSKIVRAMKSFAHQDRGDKSPADVNRTLQDTLTVAQNEYKQVASVETDLGQLPTVSCFPGQLNQVFLNIIVNAAHAIEDARKPGLGRIRVVSRARGDGNVEVRISDDGCGIPLEIRERVFDQFFTTKEVGRGSGQGLSLARSIVVDGHGGTLSFETAPGAGTTFIVTLPVEGSPASAGRASAG
jgi:PAS domain S-box-containing protein